MPSGRKRSSEGLGYENELLFDIPRQGFKIACFGENSRVVSDTLFDRGQDVIEAFQIPTNKADSEKGDYR